MSNASHTFKVNPARVAWILVGISIFLLALSVLGQFFRFYPQYYTIHNKVEELWLDFMTNQFNVNAEINVPTYFNSFILLAASFLMFIVAAWKKVQRDPLRFHWTGLGFILLIFSIDDMVSLHERMSKLFKGWTDLNGLFFFKWTIFGIMFLIVFGLVYLWFFWKLDNKFKFLFLLSAVVYFGGALGLEMIGGRFANFNTTKNFGYSLYTTLEEGMEFIGVTLLIYSTLKYIETYFPKVLFVIGKQDDKAEESEA
jgi:hypothetical protein